MKTRCDSFRTVVELIIIAIALPCIGIAGDSRYTVQGQAFYRSFGRGLPMAYDFSLSVSNNSWAMEFEGGSTNKFRSRQICDGSNLVTMTYWNYGQGKNVRGDTDGVVTVDRRTLPVDEPFIAHAAFVGFAAQLYLPPGTNGLLHPLWHPDRQVSGTPFVLSEWDPLALGGFFAETIRWRYEAQKWKKALHQTTGKSPTNKEDGKALIATYHSVGRTNLAGKVFPTACAFTAFAPDRSDGADEASPLYEIRLTNIVLRATAAASLFDARFKGVAVVEDYRTHPWLNYTITNSAPLGLP